MKNIAVLGNQHGDEGKGHITHFLSKNFDWVIRFSGGANAGHTIYRDGVKYVHNLMPSFDWRSKQTKAFLGSGMVIDLEQLHLEVKKLWNINSDLPKRVYVDPDAFIVTHLHKEIDKKTNSNIGSTNRGIGPAYVDKMSRTGLRIRDKMNNMDNINVLDLDEGQFFIKEMRHMGVHFKNVMELYRNFEEDSIIFEGAQGVMLDINHGAYPYVSCGDSTVAGIYSSGFHFAAPTIIYGVAKCYTTKVGEGPFPTEILGQEAEDLRKLGNEYGATTGRPRRVGWLDLPALDYSCKKSGINELIITKFDILNGMEKVPVGFTYGKKPTSGSDFFSTKVEYINLPGWKDASDKEQLKPFIERIEKETGRMVSYISCGTSEKDIKMW